LGQNRCTFVGKLQSCSRGRDEAHSEQKKRVKKTKMSKNSNVGKVSHLFKVGDCPLRWPKTSTITVTPNDTFFFLIKKSSSE
jgi:hypothetical protein